MRGLSEDVHHVCQINALLKFYSVEIMQIIR